MGLYRNSGTSPLNIFRIIREQAERLDNPVLHCFAVLADDVDARSKRIDVITCAQSVNRQDFIRLFKVNFLSRIVTDDID